MKVGKQVGRNRYVHKSALRHLEPKLKKQVSKARSLVNPKRYDLVKISGESVSFLQYPDFFTSPHPALQKSILVNLKSGKVQERVTGKNKPILHRKETFLHHSHPKYQAYAQATQREEKRGLLSRPDIGTQSAWKKAKGDSNATEIANATSRGSVFGQLPKLYRMPIPKRTSILDFGAGRDATGTKHLKKKGHNVTAYDFGANVNENHSRNALSRKYGVVLASNVLNVQSTPQALNRTLKQIRNAIAPNGYALANYPQSPRKLNLSGEQMRDRLARHFQVEVVDGGLSAPIFKLKRK